MAVEILKSGVGITFGFPIDAPSDANTYARTCCFRTLEGKARRPERRRGRARRRSSAAAVRARGLLLRGEMTAKMIVNQLLTLTSLLLCIVLRVVIVKTIVIAGEDNSGSVSLPELMNAWDIAADFREVMNTNIDISYYYHY